MIVEEKRNNGILLDEQRLKEVAEKHDNLIDLQFRTRR